MEIFYSASADETRAIAKQLADKLRAGDVLAFRGGLGAGKTAFTGGLAEGLGIDPIVVSSPTFALLNIYEGGRLTLYHFDMYRVTSFESLESTGFFDCLDGGGIVAVEWSENIEAELPENTITVAIFPEGEEQRRIEIDIPSVISGP